MAECNLLVADFPGVNILGAPSPGHHTRQSWVSDPTGCFLTGANPPFTAVRVVGFRRLRGAALVDHAVADFVDGGTDGDWASTSCAALAVAGGEGCWLPLFGYPLGTHFGCFPIHLGHCYAPRSS